MQLSGFAVKTMGKPFIISFVIAVTFMIPLLASGEVENPCLRRFDSNPDFLQSNVSSFGTVALTLGLRSDKRLVDLDSEQRGFLESYFPDYSMRQGIGLSYFSDVAKALGGTFQNIDGEIGLLTNIDVLRGEHFNPQVVDPRVREVYEKTSRFRLKVAVSNRRFARTVVNLSNRLFMNSVGNGVLLPTPSQNSLMPASAITQLLMGITESFGDDIISIMGSQR